MIQSKDGGFVEPVINCLRRWRTPTRDTINEPCPLILQSAMKFGISCWMSGDAECEQ